ncbi:MAG: hypothetical protein PVH84_01850 [Candidatus Aminicenantes bacterium]
MRKICLILTVLIVMLEGCEHRPSTAEGTDFPKIRGPYMGQTPPGYEPQLFAPGIISTGMYERDVAISPDGDEFYYGLAVGSLVTILVSRLENGSWTEPEIAPFAMELDFLHFEPCITPDGEKLLFLCTRPPQGQESKPGWGHQNIWAVDRNEDGSWSEPYDLGWPINTENNEYFPSVTRDGTLYFTRSSPKKGEASIYRSSRSEGKYEEPEMLPAPINGQGNLYNAFIAPDESYLIACVEAKDKDVASGITNYSVFFRSQDDMWSEGINMGERINTPGARAISPYVSPDGKYFFFASTRTKKDNFSGRAKIFWTHIQEIYSSPQNGNSDIYWVDAKVVHDLRPEGFGR